MMTPIHKINGEYFGFINDSKLFDRTNQFIGEAEGDEIWGQNGRYIGTIYETNYIIKEIGVPEKGIRKLIPFPTLSELPPIEPMRVSKSLPSGWTDALDNI